MGTEQCTEYHFKYLLSTCEEIYTINPDSHKMPGYYWIINGPTKVYCGMNFTGSTCENICIIIIILKLVTRILSH